MDSIKLIRDKINSFDVDFDDPFNFMRDVIEIVYPKKKSTRANKIIREIDELQEM